MNRVLTLLAAILGAACVAAVWSLLSLQGVSQWWLAPLAAFALVLFLHSQGVSAGGWRLAAAGLLFACSAAYAAYIEASGSIGAELGLTLIEGLRRIGPEMAWAWLRAHRQTHELSAYLLGLLLALALGWYLGRAAQTRSATALARAPQRSSGKRRKPPLKSSQSKSTPVKD